MSLIKLAASKKDIDNYNKEFKSKAGYSTTIAPVVGGLAGATAMKGLAHLVKTKPTVLEMGLAGLMGAGTGVLANHVRVHRKMDKKIRSKIAD